MSGHDKGKGKGGAPEVGSDGAADGAADGGSDGAPQASPKRPDAPPTSRIGRLARLGALSPRALPFATVAVKRALGRAPSPEEEARDQERIFRTAKQTANAMLKTLGEMKGLPLKLGQMASYIDGLAPPGYEARFQEVLTQLQSKAPPLSSEAARRVITQELDGPPEELFQSFESEPFAAASIGQVHRAVTRGGEAVAVKVQYPGIDKAIENDLKSLSTLESMVAPIGRRYGTKETTREIASVFLSELDYGHEAEMTDTFRRIHERDAEIVIPRVHHGLTTRRVLTTDLMGGTDYATFVDAASRADKDAAGATIWRFMFRSLFGHGVLYADPHPGNYRFLGGGRVAFLDFGCTKRVPDELVRGMKRYVRAAQLEDWPAFDKACVEVLGYDPDDAEGWALYRAYTLLVLTPFTTKGPFRFTKPFARESVAFLVRNSKKLMHKEGSALPNLPKPIHMPTDFTFVNRLQWGLSSVLAGLEAEADYRAITEEWMT